MKRTIVAVIALTLILSACTRVDVVLPKKEGTWNITERLTSTYQDGELASDTIEYDMGVYVFNKEGTGTLTPSGSSALEIEWSYDNQNNLLTITQTQFGSSQEFRVLESDRDSQSWFENNLVRLGGIDYVIESTYKVRRVD